MINMGQIGGKQEIGSIGEELLFGKKLKLDLYNTC